MEPDGPAPIGRDAKIVIVYFNIYFFNGRGRYSDFFETAKYLFGLYSKKSPNKFFTLVM